MEGLSEADISNMEELITTRDGDSYAFWDSPALAQWFSSKGYTLYEREWYDGRKVPYAKPRLPYEDYCEAVYPYAYHDLRIWEPDINASLFAATAALVMFAQDTQLRHVAIKLARIGSDEHKIWQFLNRQDMDVLRENCVLPILEIQYLKSACFAIMPRWGDGIYEPRSRGTLRDALNIMRARLKGVAFMHSHNIIHRDLKPDNVVVNHFGDEMEGIKYYYTRKTQLKAGLLLYGLIDYDVSILLPGPVDRANFRLPCKESYIGNFYRPSDTMQGEFDYNPFAFDIGCLGVQFCDYFQHLTRDIPLLAPFLDSLITRDISRRFTAEQALQFLENEILPMTTEEQLAASWRADDEVSCSYEYYDRWEGLSEDFKKQWGAYREPVGVPLTWRMLRWLMTIQWLPCMLIPKTRRFIYRLTYIPRLLWGHFTTRLVRREDSSVYLK